MIINFIKILLGNCFQAKNIAVFSHSTFKHSIKFHIIHIIMYSNTCGIEDSIL